MKKIKLKNQFFHESGIPNAQDNEVFELEVEGELLSLTRYQYDELHNKVTNLIQIYHIPIANILKSDMVAKNVVVPQNKNVIGRGVIGGALFGSQGMTLAALSALQTNQTQRKMFLVVEYVSQNSPEELQRIILRESERKSAENHGLNYSLKQAISHTQPSPLLINLREKLNPGGVVLL